MRRVLAALAAIAIAATLSACRSSSLPGASSGPATKAIVHPRLMSSQQAASLPASERVLAVSIGKAARAYPLSVLNRHQVIDDTVGGEPLAVTFCPLTQSAAVFKRTVDGKPTEFEVSDELYQSNLVLSDAATRSLWSQVEGAAIKGPMAGRHLEVVPCVVTQWGLWKKFHPTSAIIDGLGANSPNPFAKYEKSPGPAFPVSHLDRRLPAKTMVLGIRSGNESRVFPFSSLAQSRGFIQATVDRTLFDVIYDKKTQTVGASLNGKHIAAYTGYWFAWAAVHPKSEIWGEPVPKFPPPPKTFRPAAALNAPREGMSLTTLRNGEVLMAGGDNGQKQMLDTAELYNPRTNKWTPTGKMNVARGGQTATLLPDGTVLLAGGIVDDGQPTAAAEIYNPKTGRFTRIADMHFARGGQTATPLKNGTVLIAGGFDRKDLVRQAEIYHPATRTFTLTGTMTAGRDFHTATLMHDGRVLLTGGGDATHPATASAEIYNPKTGRFTATDDMMARRASHAAALLPDGSVLVAGGDNSGGSLRSAEIYNPKTGKFRPTLSLMIPSDGLKMVSLPDGKVLAVGGSFWIKKRRIYVGDAEIYEPKAGKFVLGGKMSIGRYKPSIALMPGGKVLVAGSFASPGLPATNLIDIYSPAAATTVAAK